jgi:ParB family chromosome partitioning protein
MGFPDHAAAIFTSIPLRMFLRLPVQIDLYRFLEEAANHFAGNGENLQQTGEEIVLSVLENNADDKLTGVALRLALTDHLSIPLADQSDLLAETEVVFSPLNAEASKTKSTSKAKETPAFVNTSRREL